MSLPHSKSKVEVPEDLRALQERISEMPPGVREALLPWAEQAAENALFRGRVLSLAREGLEQYRLDLAIMRFDLESTKRELEDLRKRVMSMTPKKAQ